MCSMRVMPIFKNIVLLLLMLIVTSACCNCPTESVSQDMGVITKKRIRRRYTVTRYEINSTRRYTMTEARSVYLITTQQQSFCVPRDTFSKYKEGDHYYRYEVVCHHLDTCIYSSNYRKR